MSEEPWHRRIRRLGDTQATALCELFHTREVLTLDGNPATTWSFEPARTVAPPAAVLRGSSDQLLLSIREDGLCERLGAREWCDYEGESRLLAWILAHGFLLESLGRLLREPILPIAWSDAALLEAATTETATLGFSAAAADGRTCRGFLGLPPALVSRLTTSTGWQSNSATHTRWLQLPVTLRIELRSERFPLAELAAARTGDVLVLGRSARCWHGLRMTTVGTTGTIAAGGDCWSASYEGDRLHLGAALPLTATEVNMLETTPESAAGAGSRSAMANVPVTLDFEVGSLSLPLSELANLKPGYVFRLPGRLEEAQVVIRANGVRIGNGELVAVGDVLGVQLLLIESNGIR
jgi:type III secretion protein Q